MARATRRRLGGAFESAPHLGRLTATQCERLHEATLQVLERTGLIVDEPEALELLRHAGASVDGTRLRIPARLVDAALETAPTCVSLYDRNGREAIRCEGYRTYFGPGSDCMWCHDHRTGERRRAVLQDVRDAATVTDACANLDFAMSLFSPSDVTPVLMDRYQMEAMLAHTGKPIVYVTLNDERAHLDVTRMAAAVVGDERALAERPLVACYKNTLFPLVHNREAVRTLLDLSGAGLPCIYSPVSTAGTVAPMTVLGSTVVVNAGVLAGLVMSQLKREGAPFIAIGWAGEPLDMRTMVDVFAGPDHRGIYPTLLHWYDLPMWSLGGVSDSKLPDQQAAAEAALTFLTDAVIGGHMSHNIGFLESAYTGSLSQLALGDDIVRWIRAFTAPVELTDEALGLDVIDEVGPGGLFLKHKHTRRHARERFEGRVFDRRSYADWAADGAVDATARAAARVDEILATHRCELLPDDVTAAVRAVIDDAEHLASR
jgi:trimethylamine---corrinoid protein Co-methyltransferase